MEIPKYFFLVPYIVILIGSNVLFAQENCCSKNDCKTNAEKLSREISTQIAFLGPDPNSFEAREKILDSFKIVNKSRYQKIVILIKEIDDFNKENLFGLNCINEFVDNEDVLDWLTHFYNKYENVKSLSPEFCKGFGLHLDLNTGVADLFKNSESFSSSFRVLLAYTFSRKNCGGKIRALLGPSVYYQDEKAILMINPRAEFRLLDIGNDLTSIGNLKLIAQANFNANTLITGLGLGAELDNFGVQLLGEYQTGIQKYSIQTGIFYRFRL